MITKLMLLHWADYGLLLVNILLITVNHATKSFVSHVHANFSSNLHEVKCFHKFIDRVLNFYIQGFFTFFIAALVYILFFGYSSYPAEVKEYSEYFQCIAVGIVSGGVYAAIAFRNIYRLLKLEHDIISQH